MNERITLVPYIPQSSTTEEVEKALISYYEVLFIAENGKITAKTTENETYLCNDYAGQDSMVVMPQLSSRPECLSCFFIDGIGDLFYQTNEYIRFYDDDMELKKLYMIKEMTR